MDSPFSTMEIALLSAQQEPIIMDKPVLVVLPHKDGMELTVLIDVLMEESGMLPHRVVSVRLDNSGMDLPVLSAPMVELGI